MSSSLDKTVRLWDLRSPNCRGSLTLPAYPVVAYDSTGVVFAVAVNHYSRVLLYDQANYDKAPFLTIVLDDPYLSTISYPPRPIFVTSMSFSSNGKYLLLGCSGPAHYVLDAFDGAMLAKLEGHIGMERKSLNAQPIIEPVKGISGEEVSWTPDGKYVIGGSLDGRIFIWDIQNIPERPEGVRKPLPRLEPLHVLDAHPTPSCCVKFNPRFAMLATAGTDLVRVFHLSTHYVPEHFARHFGCQIRLETRKRVRRNCQRSDLHHNCFLLHTLGSLTACTPGIPSGKLCVLFCQGFLFLCTLRIPDFVLMIAWTPLSNSTRKWNKRKESMRQDKNRRVR